MTDIIEHYVDQHIAGFATFPGAGLGWLDDQRKNGIRLFKQSGFPGPRDEDWRYTSLRPVTSKLFQVNVENQQLDEKIEDYLIPELDSYRLVFVDGQYVPEQSTTIGLTAGVVANSFEQLVRLDPGVVSEASGGELSAVHGFAALNIAFSRDGYLIQLPDNTKLDKPLEVVFLSASNDLTTQPRNIIRLGKFSEAKIIERHASKGKISSLVNSTNQISLDQGAKLDYYLVQSPESSNYQVTSVDAELNKDSQFLCGTVSLGGDLVRNNLTVQLNQPGAHCDMLGLYNLSGRQHVDNHTNIIHKAEHCTSRELYKGVLDQRSKAVFHGRINVKPNAQQTNATQANNNLLLSVNAEAVTKPQLEIYADDVKCAHGATVGQLDEDSLFYLRSRGIDEQSARLMLTRAFVSDVLAEISIDPLRVFLEAKIAQRLNVDG